MKVVARNTCNPVPFIAVESKVSTLHWPRAEIIEDKKEVRGESAFVCVLLLEFWNDELLQWWRRGVCRFKREIVAKEILDSDERDGLKK